MSCRECARNFARAAGALLDRHNGTDAPPVPYQQRRDGAIIWLWRAHNRANSRLHNDVTEDPMFLKVQFPSAELCAQCRHNVTSASDASSGDILWNEGAVLDFLLQFYGAQSVIDDDIHDTFSGNSNTLIMVSSACHSYYCGLHAMASLILVVGLIRY